MANNYMAKMINIRAIYDLNPEIGSNPQCIFWFQNASPGALTVGQLTTIAGNFDGALGAVNNAFLATNKHYLGSIVTDWQNNQGLQYTSVGVMTPMAGTLGNSLPYNVAALNSWHIGLRWKGGHFRTYLPYVGTGAVTAGSNDLTASAVTNLHSAFGTMITDMAGSGILGGQTLVMYKWAHTKNPATQVPTWYVPATWTVQTALASQRRRQRKVTRK